MGLFEKKLCCICGEKAGLLSRAKLKDKTYLCGDCRDKCSPDMTLDLLSYMDGDAVRRHMEYVVDNAQIYKDQFRENYAIYKEGLSRKTVVSCDLEKYWWVKAESKMPDIFSFDQIQSYQLYLDTSPLSEGDRPEPPILPPEGYNLQVCPPGHKIDRMYVVVRLNHPWITQLELNVMDSLIPTPNEIQSGYYAAAQIYDLFAQYRQAQTGK